MTRAPVGVSPPTAGSDGSQTLQIVAEKVTVSKRVRRTRVSAALTTSTREQTVEAELNRNEVVVERVPIGRVVDQVPAVRIEGDVTVLSVVEEEFVVVKRLVLVEEIRLTTVRSVSRHVEKVSLRKQDVSIARTPIED